MIITSGILAREVQIKEVEANGEKHKVLNNCIFIKGKGSKDIPLNITAWDDQAVTIAENYMKGDCIHMIAEETPETFRTGDRTIDIFGCTIKTVSDVKTYMTIVEMLKAVTKIAK